MMTTYSTDLAPTNRRDRAARAPARKPGQTVAILFAVVLFLAAVAGATVIWGLPGLAMSALAMVPVCVATLLLLTVGK